MEQILEKKQQSLQEIEQSLADVELYQDKTRADELRNYQEQSQSLNEEITRLEDEVLEKLEDG